MKKFFYNKSILIVASIIIIAMNFLSRNSYAAGVYTAELSKGDCLKLIGDTWTIYPTKENAISLKKDARNTYLKKGEQIIILGVYGNVLKIKDNGYIYYGSTADKNFKKIEKKIEKKNEDIKDLIGIIIKNKPNKIQYNVGEKFDTNGMIVIANYSDKSNKEIKDYTILDGDKLKVDQNSVTIRYAENNIIKETKISIKVNRSQETEKVDKQKRIVELARKQKGKGYQMGASGPNKFDCSGLTLYVYKKVLNVNLPHKAGEQAKYGKAVSFSTKGGKIDCSKMQLGDLIVFKGHVGIYSGNGKMIDAAGKNKGVVERSFNNSYWIKTQPIKAVRRLV